MNTQEKTTRGGSHEQHVKAGEQSSGNRANPAQHAEAGKKGGEASRSGGSHR
jgi:general stress protein YciG